MIYGIGLPRTGTTSLAEALRILDYKGRSHCSVTIRSKADGPGDGWEFEVDNLFYKFLDNIPKKDIENNLFILTTKSYKSWLESISKFEYNGPTVLHYEEKVKSLIPYNQLLVVDWSTCKESGCNWKKLCKFLGKPVPDEEFPCKNCPGSPTGRDGGLRSRTV